METYVCPKCGKSIFVSSLHRTIICSCGNASAGNSLASISDQLSCIHRGEVLGDLDCGCAGKPKVYACNIHGKCAIRKMKPGDFGVVYCNGCEDISLYRQGRVGLALDDLCKTSKNIFAWGCTDDLAESYKLYPSANLVAVHHGSLASSWGNDVFKRQLEFCQTGVAVNRDVANRFGVRFIRNPVDPSRSDPQGDMPEQLSLIGDDKIVL
jgi:hypothetical protein